MDIFQNLAGNGLYSCSWVVSVLRVKMWLFYKYHVTLSRLLIVAVLLAIL